ncbi:uncharacterized protein LOC132628769 [Lycium barbarum]|uniref:uncharacterized protein LOC132628769 n=1 Tax=Lycium barbarum TaxID=112863 RepID=UPI00293E9518|nr:uncharacterized protein LOC132628769 [Lycium barbarum]
MRGAHQLADVLKVLAAKRLLIGGNPVTFAEVVDFQHFLDECELSELPNTGCQFTWSDKHGTDKIFIKIDWALVNGEWVGNMPQCIVNVLPEGVSDHCPLVVKVIEDRTKKKSSFKFSNIWSTHPDFLRIVAQDWAKEVVGCKMHKIVKQLKLLKGSLRKLLGKDDVNRRQAQAQIFSQGARLTIEQQMQLVQAYTAKDVKQAMFSINENKSPRPDSYGSGFFRAA